jgi:lysozyme
VQSLGRVRRYAKKVRKRLWPVAAIAALLAFGAILMVVMLFTGEREPTLELPGCVDVPVTPGIDVSYYQDKIEWQRVRKTGIRFAFIRVSDGLSVRDPMFTANWEGARHAHLARGAYQHFRPEESATSQADLVVEAVQRDRGELPPVLDVEVTGGKSPVQIEKAIRLWIERIRARLHVEPIIYTSPEFWRGAVGGADLTTQPLWVAHYTAECPRVPAPWTRWMFWQHSETGQVPGIQGPVDLDVLAGDLDALSR